MTQNGSTDHDLYPFINFKAFSHIIYFPLFICSTMLYFGFKQEYTHTAWMEAHLASINYETILFWKSLQ